MRRHPFFITLNDFQKILSIMKYWLINNIQIFLKFITTDYMIQIVWNIDIQSSNQ